MSGGIKRTMVSDNLPKLTHAPLKVFVSPWKLPSFDGWYGGDPHYHSDMTQDQVEFGAPVEVAAVMGKAMGLNWLAVADHSYDLDRAMGEYFQYDSGLARWRKVHEDASLVNSRNDGFVVIPAEEVSCGNSRAHNIHLLAFDTPQFIPGTGDGVKRGLNKRPTLTLRQCLNRINEAGGFAYAAHPEMGNGFLGMLMLNRGCWRDPDYAQGGYSGMQIWNGVQGKVFTKSREKWIQLLLEVLKEDYITTARGKGLRENIVLLRHALRNAMITIITVVGLIFGLLLGGAVVTEQVFTLPGVGRLVVEAVSRRDYPTVQGILIFIAFFYATVNLIVDLLYAFLDPRIRYD